MALGSDKSSPSVHIRPLKEEDASVSYMWRNDPLVWHYTASRPDREITEEIERDWLRGAFSDPTARRFAICVDEGGAERYVGNIQLTDISRESAQYHVFIGDRRYWGKGVASRATEEILDVAFGEMELHRVWLVVDSRHEVAIRLYERHGFVRSAVEPEVTLPDGSIFMVKERDRPGMRDPIG